MSADSLRKQSKQGYHGQVILPQPINDLSLIESVAGFIHEVVPQAYSSVLPGDSKDGILWARFDSTDYNDPENFPQLSECESESTPPLLLILGYSSGVQVWSVGGSGEATELLSWCQGAVRALRILLRPSSRDPHSSKRPLVAIVDSSSPGPQFATLSFISLKTAEVVKIIKFNSAICDVHCNRKSIVVTFSERIAVFDSATLEDRLTITTCYPSPGNSPNPVALGPRWLAYGEKRLTTWQRSSGGCEGDGAQSYTSTVIHAAKSLGKGLRELGGSLTGSTTQTSHNPQAQPGIVSIIDLERKCSTSEDEKGNMMAHFIAHTSAVVAMAFDPSGLLLVTADRHGHRFNVFRLHSHPCTAQLAAVHHLYVLHRGETTARVQDIAVSWDSRWVAVSSVRGTTHVFPITPYGGLVTVRTHTTSHVVNKLSRFERSAGLRDGRGSPLPCEAPPTPPPPRLPPYPHPSVGTPLAQLRARPDDAPLAAFFAPPRAWLPGRPKSKRTCADSLYIIYTSGAFMQYDLDPKVLQGVVKEKISFDTPIELGIEAKAEWILPKPPYTSSLCPPLPPGHVLLDLPPRPHQPPDKWLSQVEIVTHTGPHRRLWMGPQFLFKSIDPLPMSSAGEGDSGGESGNPLRSNPVNMPHRPFLLVEIGSGSPKMTEVDEAGGRLREDLADAMLETQNASGQARGRLRRAEVEWQVNPLGAVQTHPKALSHWPHPIFFQPYSEELYKPWQQEQQLSTEKKVEAALDRIRLQERTLDQGLSREGDSVSTSKPVTIEEPSEHTDEDARVSERVSSPSSSSIPSVETILSTGSADKDPEIIGDLQIVESKSKISTVKEIETNPVKKGSKPETSTLIEKTCDDKFSPKQDTEEKPRPGKKGRKKRNGNDKKSKKDQSRISCEETNLSAIISDTNLETEKIVESTVLVETTKSKNEQDISTDILEITDELRGNPDVHQLYDIAIEENPGLSLSCVDQDVFFPYASGTESILACGIIEITEDVSLIDDENIPPFNESPEIQVTTEPILEGLDEVELRSTVEEDLAEVLPEECSTPLNPSIGEVNLEESSALSIGKALLEEELPLPPLTFSVDTSLSPVPETLEVSCSDHDKDFNGNNTSNQIIEDIQVIGINPCQLSDEVVTTHEELNCSIDIPISKELESTVSTIESEEFITVPSKSNRNKNRRKKKEKKQEETIQTESCELESSESVVLLKEEGSPIDIPVEEKLPLEVETNDTNITPVENLLINTSSDIIYHVNEENIVSTEKLVLDEEVVVLPMEIKSSMEDSLKSISLDATSSVLLSDDIQSDQIASTDKSEVEDISSHSGKESDDSKCDRKERSRKQKRSESSDKDRADLKKKSPSPAAGKSDAGKDSESSDEASRIGENKQCTPKGGKRKKGKKSEEEVLECSIVQGSGVVPRRRLVTERRSTNGNTELQNIGIEDRDSVYESCNDDGASDSLAFESSKEDFDDGSAKTTVTEPSSSNTEDKNDSNDKNIQPLKKMRKQKKKKR